MGRLTVRLRLAAYGFLADHRRSGPIHFDIENRNRLADDDGRSQLDGLLHFFLFTLIDVFFNCFRDALNRFGSHFQTGQYFHLLAAVIEGGVPSHQSVHAAHAGRELGVLNVQFHFGRKLALMTVRAQSRDHRLRPGPQLSARTWNVFTVAGQLATVARSSSVVGAANCSNAVSAAEPAWRMAARTALSTASRSRRPVLRRPLKTAHRS
jgi:hypothetical protein